MYVPIMMMLTNLYFTVLHGHVLSTTEPRAWDGKNTLEYERVKTNLTSIMGALKSNPSASESLREKFKEKGWLTPAAKPTEEELVTHALGRIELDPNQCGKFIAMLSDITGMDLIVNRLTGMTSYFCIPLTVYIFVPTLLYGKRVVWKEVGKEGRKDLEDNYREGRRQEGTRDLVV